MPGEGGSSLLEALPGDWGGGGRGVALHCLPPEMLSGRHPVSQDRVWSPGCSWVGARLGGSPRWPSVSCLTFPRTKESRGWVQAVLFSVGTSTSGSHVSEHMGACVCPRMPP